ncbi:MAG: RNA-guided pseudouridylation complex pseudouridine synthase subunit Cbf5 [Nanoarchaeota archaeon]|nr:RNA-guided pseudouridylation complex pseudouridine synthase subunit Cbf5 [Nanoarchaeota archaeon]MBU1030143.1 RNA-guided pseudouridylation complex pseudouridine synthase subunit Cbf5 [Nanoarchaeota archaeon]MBU1850419.1 RNA-guided pseudouridylation complex pseudouridine synthase subunit Cbf5 [Nanoarchaeota archaeon]
MGKLPFEGKNRAVLVKRTMKTDPKFGKSPEERTTDELLDYSIVNIDKPAGPSSHQVSAYVKKIVGVDKAGHSGTLDPKVTGVLPVAVGRATRIAESLLTAGKEYVCLMKLHKLVSDEKIREVMKKFVGKIRQLPPIKSAVKRRLRYRTIYYIEILDIKEKSVLFIVGCQAGTYIRKLCHDIGATLGVGANMFELRRTKAGPFTEETLCTLQDLTDAFYYYKEENDDKYLKKLLQPIENGVLHLPKIWVLDSTVDTICHGASLKVPGIAKVEDGIEPDLKVAIMTLKGELVAVGISLLTSKKILTQERGVAVKLGQVFMSPGVYPKIEKV